MGLAGQGKTTSLSYARMIWEGLSREGWHLSSGPEARREEQDQEEPDWSLWEEGCR